VCFNSHSFLRLSFFADLNSVRDHSFPQSAGSIFTTYSNSIPGGGEPGAATLQSQPNSSKNLAKGTAASVGY
jgi:hypothetical protein